MNFDLRIACLALAVMSGSSLAGSTVWQNSLKPAGRPDGEIHLASQGRTGYVIVLPAKPTTQDEKAAADLAHWLHAMTGATFRIVSDATAPSRREICLGHTSRLASAGLSNLAKGLGDEGYAIAVRGERIFLAGGRLRGPIYAVYALLEEDLGLRWYSIGTETIPHRPTVTFRPVPRRYVPPLMIRDPFYAAAFDGTWSLRNRTNSPSAPVPKEWGGHATYALFVHTFNTLVPPGEYFEAHPEYFMLNVDGKRNPQQLCTTNEDVIRIATESTLRFLREKPDSRVISVSKNDGGGTCVCERCKALDDAEGTNAAALLYMVNRIAEKVEAEFPDVLVCTLAYLETVKPPKTMRPRPNVAMQLCTDNCMWAHPFTPAREVPAFKEAMEGWSAICDKILIWDYCVNFSHYTAPMPNMDAIADNIRYFIAHHAAGVMEQGAYQSVGAERDAMRSWVFAKLMWDPTRDLRSLERDFILGYFGKAGPPILEYNELLRKSGEAHAQALANPEGGIRYGMDSPFLTKELLDRADALYDQAERQADSPEILARVQRDRLPILYVKLCRGPQFVGAGYAKLIDDFERIARQVGLTHILEGAPDVDAKLAHWRETARLDPSKVQAASLANEWRFRLDPDDVGIPEKWYAPETNDSDWATVRSDTGTGWESQGFAGHSGYGWYRQQFEVHPEVLEQPGLRLFFGAVDEQAWIYINGELAFEHTVASTGLPVETLWTTPFGFDPRPFLKAGTNTIAVRVHDVLGMAGIWRPVTLIWGEVDYSPAMLWELVRGMIARSG